MSPIFSCGMVDNWGEQCAVLENRVIEADSDEDDIHINNSILYEYTAVCLSLRRVFCVHNVCYEMIAETF